MSHTSVGLCDTPLEPSDADCLGLDRYARALADFAEECATPMTIALQGDWGSGKTSLMNLIRGRLSKKKEHCICIWFNTWQYSQFGLENQLAISLISFFISELLPDNTEEKLSYRKFLAQFGRALSATGKGMGGPAGMLMNAVGGTVTTMADAKAEEPDVDPAGYIAELKKKLAELVRKTTEKNERIIVFIDDLDRLPPVRAVELLEAFKLFLDIHGCVFFLACDYKVITQGLKAKFGEEIASNNEKSFFDKIIQLPFKMPVLQYEVGNYIENLLENIGITYDKSDIKKYHDLIITSIGFNPRGLKRAFNTLLLLKRVAEAKGEPESDPETVKNVQQNEKDRLLFAIICMQLTYEAFYKFIYKFMAAELITLFDKLRALNKYTKDEDIKTLLKEINTESEQERLQKFIDPLFKAMQLNFDNRDNILSPEEAQVFLDMMKLSQVTSIEEVQDTWEEQDYALRDINREVCKKLLNSLNTSVCFRRRRKFKHKPHRGISDMEVILDGLNGRPLTKMGIWFGRTADEDDPYSFDIRAYLSSDDEDEDEDVLDSVLTLIQKIPRKMKDDFPKEIKYDEKDDAFVSVYYEKHNCMDEDDLLQKVEPIAKEYFSKLLDI